MNIDEQERIDAVNRYLKGDKPSNVCRDVNRSEKWLFKWINRFKTGEVEWYISHSRAPKKHGEKEQVKLFPNRLCTIRCIYRHFR
ncbi:MAG: helix-turn-helix domain-containing protein [Methanosarcinaceae archaeon]